MLKDYFKKAKEVFDTVDKALQKPGAVPVPQTSHDQGKGVIEFYVSGTPYHQKEIDKLGSPIKKYTMDHKLLTDYIGRKIYEKYYKAKVVALVPEPTNKHDPNAIKVMLDGQHAGYVPRDLAFNVKEMLKTGSCSVHANISGGKYKVIDGNYDAVYWDENISVKITIIQE